MKRCVFDFAARHSKSSGRHVPAQRVTRQGRAAASFSPNVFVSAFWISRPMPNTTYCLDLELLELPRAPETCQDSISSCRCDRGKEWATTDEANLGTPDTAETADTTTHLTLKKNIKN